MNAKSNKTGAHPVCQITETVLAIKLASNLVSRSISTVTTLRFFNRQRIRLSIPTNSTSSSITHLAAMWFFYREGDLWLSPSKRTILVAGLCIAISLVMHRRDLRFKYWRDRKTRTSCSHRIPLAWLRPGEYVKIGMIGSISRPMSLRATQVSDKCHLLWMYSVGEDVKRHYPGTYCYVS